MGREKAEEIKSEEDLLPIMIGVPKKPSRGLGQC
jgi:hypothetical protein